MEKLRLQFIYGYLRNKLQIIIEGKPLLREHGVARWWKAIDDMHKIIPDCPFGWHNQADSMAGERAGGERPPDKTNKFRYVCHFLSLTVRCLDRWLDVYSLPGPAEAVPCACVCLCVCRAMTICRRQVKNVLKFLCSLCDCLLFLDDTFVCSFIALTHSVLVLLMDIVYYYYGLTGYCGRKSTVT